MFAPSPSCLLVLESLHGARDGRRRCGLYGAEEWEREPGLVLRGIHRG
jgi:hypothetical protein